MALGKGSYPIPKHGEVRRSGRKPLLDVDSRKVKPLPVKVLGLEEEGLGVGSIIRDYLATIIVIQVAREGTHH